MSGHASTPGLPYHGHPQRGYSLRMDHSLPSLAHSSSSLRSQLYYHLFPKLPSTPGWGRPLMPPWHFAYYSIISPPTRHCAYLETEGSHCNVWLWGGYRSTHNISLSIMCWIYLSFPRNVRITTDRSCFWIHSNPFVCSCFICPFVFLSTCYLQSTVMRPRKAYRGSKCIPVLSEFTKQRRGFSNCFNNNTNQKVGLC